MGVRLTWPDGAADLVGFRTDPDAKTVRCGGMASDGVCVRPRDRCPRTPLRSIEQPQE